jgi:hypothetical protein
MLEEIDSNQPLGMEPLQPESSQAGSAVRSVDVFREPNFR